jgi:outer membrane receptor protein involved in Fe transport
MLHAATLRVAILVTLASPSIAAPPSAGRDAGSAAFDLSLEELMDVVVVSPNRQAERLRDAPAALIVLDADDLRERGYRDLSEIFDDLPGMDVSRAQGDTLYRVQWRGLRKSISVPYLLLMDGLPLNHLYFNQDEILAALPINAIERIEVVYGPAAVTYGANAFAGVINVIRRTLSDAHDQQARASVTLGSFGRSTADIWWAFRRGEHQLSLAARRDRGGLDRDATGGLPSLSEAYFADRRLWGAFADGPLGGRYRSQHDHLGVDLRWRWRDLQATVQYFALETGYGNVYAGDTVQNDGRWREPELALALQADHRWGAWQGSSRVRYRESGVADDSYFVEGYELTDGTGVGRRVVDFSYWGSENRSLSLSHDGQWQITPQWALLGGAHVERRSLQKAYRTNYGPAVDPRLLARLEDYPFPERASFDTIAANRKTTNQSALYAQARWQARGLWAADDSHTAIVGVRHDRFSALDDATTLRGGYVYGRGAWTAKLLYGQSFNEPAARELYGGWRGSGSDPDLAPETGDTRELALHRTAARTSQWLSIWKLRTRNDIITFSGGALNLGRRDVRGIDVGMRVLLGPSSRPPHELWLYGSWIDASEERPTPGAAPLMMRSDVGDTAPWKWHGGWTWRPAERVTVNVRGRWVGERHTVDSNPVRRVGGYATFDAHLDWALAAAPGWRLGLGVTNLFDRRYAHPGLRSAGAGITPGRFDGNGNWQGSPDFFNSLLPQPGRGVQLTLGWDR